MRQAALFLCCCLWCCTLLARELILQPTRDTTVVLSESDLRSLFQQHELLVDDIEYRQQRIYQGVLLNDVLAHTGFVAGQQLILKAVDGYSVSFDSGLLKQPGLTALLVLRDVNAPAGKNYEPFLHGRDWVDFSPFYLVWLRRDDSAPSLASLPWPYQLQRIELATTDYFDAIKPPPALRQGYDLFVDNCVKCHAIKGVGGSLGPSLDSKDSLCNYLDDSRLKHLISRVTDFFPKTKMPVFENSLSAADIDQLVAYVRWSNSAD